MSVTWRNHWNVKKLDHLSSKQIISWRSWSRPVFPWRNHWSVKKNEMPRQHSWNNLPLQKNHWYAKMQWWQLNQCVQTNKQTKNKKKHEKRERKKKGKLPWFSVLKKEICIINSNTPPLTKHSNNPLQSLRQQLCIHVLYNVSLSYLIKGFCLFSRFGQSDLI